MSHIKNFGLAGVGSDVQFGKSGGRLVYDTGQTVFRALQNDGATLAQVRVALNPIGNNDAASKNYVDTTAQGLAVKDSVRVATRAVDMSALTYNAAGDGGLGSWTYTAPLVIDGVTLSVDDRVLVKNQDENTAEDGPNGRGNGLFKVNGANDELIRTDDADGSPAGEMRGGVFVFVSEGVVNGSTGWAISQPDGNISIGTDEVTWSQFSGAGTLTAGNGLGEDGSELFLDLNNLGSAATASGDSIAFYDTSSGTTNSTTISSFLDDQNILTNANGSNPLTVNTGNGLEQAVSGTSSVLDLDINGTSNTATASGDEMIFHDITASGTNIKRTIGEFLSDHGVFTSGTTGTQLTASNGVEIDSNDIQLNIPGLNTVATTTSDLLVLDDGASGTAVKRTVGNFLTDHGVVQDSDFTTNGLMTRTGSGAYTNRTITASTVAGDEGLSVVNGDGVSGNPTVGLDIAGLTLVSSTASTDQVVIFDGTNNVRANLSDVVAGATVAWDTITDGTTSATADTSSDTLTFTGQDGISLTVSDNPETLTAELAINTLGTANAVTGSDLFVVHDNDSPGNHIARSATNVLADLNVVNNLGGNGFAVQTATDTYTARSIDASTTLGEEGITITNGDGVSGNPTVGVDITGQTALGAAPAGNDEILIYDLSATQNKKVTITNLAAAVASVSDDTAISDADGDTTVTVEETADADQIVLKSGLANPGTAQTIATFETANTTNDDEQFKFLNAEGEVRIEAGDAGGFGSASTNDVDIRLVPGSNGQVFIGETGAGLIQADDNNSLTAKGGDAVGGDAGDLILEGGDGATSNASGDVVIRGGTGGTAEGIVFIQDSSENEVMTFDGVASAVNYWNATNSATGGSIDLAAEGDDTNITMQLTPKGTGTVQVPTGYESNISADEDLVNKAYVDTEVSGAVSGSTGSVTGTVDFTSATTQSIGTIPANAVIQRVHFTVDVASDVATEVDFGDATNGAAAYMDDTLNDPEVVDTYVNFVNLFGVGGSSVTANATVTNAGSTGSGTVIIEYRNA